MHSAGKASTLPWGMQVTPSLPLEVIHDLMRLAVAGQTHVLLGGKTSNMVYVTKAFFQGNPFGIKEADVKKDVLGLFSLVLNHAKAAEQLDQVKIVKYLSSISISAR